MFSSCPSLEENTSGGEEGRNGRSFVSWASATLMEGRYLPDPRRGKCKAKKTRNFLSRHLKVAAIIKVLDGTSSGHTCARVATTTTLNIGRRHGGSVEGKLPT